MKQTFLNFDKTIALNDAAPNPNFIWIEEMSLAANVFLFFYLFFFLFIYFFASL